MQPMSGKGQPMGEGRPLCSCCAVPQRTVTEHCALANGLARQARTLVQCGHARIAPQGEHEAQAMLRDVRVLKPVGEHRMGPEADTRSAASAQSRAAALLQCSSRHRHRSSSSLCHAHHKPLLRSPALILWKAGRSRVQSRPFLPVFP